MKPAVIIPTYGQWEYAKEAIETAAANTPGGLVVVIDDASPVFPGLDIVRAWAGPSGICQRYEVNGGLSRSWNRGIQIAIAMGCDVVVCGNSDCHYPPGWFDAIAEALGHHPFVGPITNAPGHCPAQDVEAYLLGYRLSEEPEAIAETQRQAFSMRRHPIPARRLNGFTFAGWVDQFLGCAFQGQQVFRVDKPLDGNEDDFFTRATSRGRWPAVALGSFVFHYRSVSRGLKGRGIEKGWRRKESLSCCD